jgi:glutamate racemase
MQGKSEQRTEAYKEYDEEAGKLLTQQSAKSAGSITSSARKQASTPKTSKIGVFDSGVGGQSVADAIDNALPGSEVIYVNDSDNVPYGTKTPEQLWDLCLPKLKKLASDGCEVIVVACNSVSVTILDKLQKELPVPLIGAEPMIEEAVRWSKNGVIAVCATPLTLASERYRQLREENSDGMVLIEPDCSEWAFMIEHNAIDRAKIRVVTEDVIQQGADVIVLGCTHYHWIESLMESIADGKADILQPEANIINRIKKELAQLP